MALQVTITFDPVEGRLGVAGSPELMNNQILLFGVLEATKVAIVQKAQQNENRVQPVSMLPPNFPVKP